MLYDYALVPLNLGSLEQDESITLLSRVAA